MRLIYAPYGIELNLSENRVYTLVVENQKAFCSIMQDLLMQVNGGSGEWILSEAENILPFARNCILIDNPLVVNCNEKKILTRLYNELAENVNDSMQERYTQLNSEVVMFLESLLQTVPYHLDFEVGVDLPAIFKTYSVKIAEDSTNPLEYLIDYLRAMRAICGIRIVWILNLKQYFSKEQVIQLYEICFYEKIILINIEGQRNYSLESEACVIIDMDLCLIDLSMN